MHGAFCCHLYWWLRIDRDAVMHNVQYGDPIQQKSNVGQRARLCEMDAKEFHLKARCVTLKRACWLSVEQKTHMFDF